MTSGRPEPLVIEAPGALVHILVSRRRDGDFHIDAARASASARLDLERRRRALVDAPWTQPDEVHGRGVLVVDRPGDHDLAVGDAVVTAADGAVIGIWTGDCAPVALVGDDGAIAGVHAGWRGVAAGVIEAAVDRMRERGAVTVRAVLGPCIHPCCYEFGADDLDALVGVFGGAVRSRDREGRPALDMRALVAAALDRRGVTALDDRSECTGCRAESYFSHRVRRERERQVMAIWRVSA